MLSPFMDTGNLYHNYEPPSLDSDCDVFEEWKKASRVKFLHHIFTYTLQQKHGCTSVSVFQVVYILLIRELWGGVLRISDIQ